MNERLLELYNTALQETGADHIPPDFVTKFAELMIKDFNDACDQAWAFNQKEKNKEGIGLAEQMVYAGAMAQCQKMKENIKEIFGV